MNEEALVMGSIGRRDQGYQDEASRIVIAVGPDFKIPNQGTKSSISSIQMRKCML